jgi:hypothetical protein
MRLFKRKTKANSADDRPMSELFNSGRRNTKKEMAAEYIKAIETSVTTDYCICEWSISDSGGYRLPQEPHPACPVHTKEGLVLGYLGFITSRIAGELRRPCEWLHDARYDHLDIVDYDGWHSDEWAIPISRIEFEIRLSRCTLNFRSQIVTDKLTSAVDAVDNIVDTIVCSDVDHT